MIYNNPHLYFFFECEFLELKGTSDLGTIHIYVSSKITRSMKLKYKYRIK